MIEIRRLVHAALLTKKIDGIPNEVDPTPEFITIHCREVDRTTLLTDVAFSSARCLDAGSILLGALRRVTLAKIRKRHKRGHRALGTSANNWAGIANLQNRPVHLGESVLTFAEANPGVLRT